MRKPARQTRETIRADKMRETCYCHIHVPGYIGCHYIAEWNEKTCRIIFEDDISSALPIDVEHIELIQEVIRTDMSYAQDVKFFVCDEVNAAVPLAMRLKYGLK